MTMAGTDQLSETIHSLKDAAMTALNKKSADAFANFERYLNEVEAYVREVQQSMWADEARATMRRLKKGDSLNESDREMIRAFLISDAEGYLANENNYADWVRELHRLIDDLERRVNVVDRESIVHLRGVLKDAIRLVPDIRNYLAERRRVEKFEQAMITLDQTSRDMLHRLLAEQLRDPNR